MGVWMVFCLSVLVLWQTCPGCTLLPALWQLIKASGPVWTKQQKMDGQTSHCTLFLFSDANRELDDTGWKYTLICTKLNQTFVLHLYRISTLWQQAFYPALTFIFFYLVLFLFNWLEWGIYNWKCSFLWSQNLQQSKEISMQVLVIISVSCKNKSKREHQQLTD